MMPDVSTLKELIAKYDEHKATEPELHKRAESESGAEYESSFLAWYQKERELRFAVGREFCKVTADRNSPNHYNCIAVTFAKSLVDAIEKGEYQ